MCTNTRTFLLVILTTQVHAVYITDKKYTLQTVYCIPWRTALWNLTQDRWICHSCPLDTSVSCPLLWSRNANWSDNRPSSKSHHGQSTCFTSSILHICNNLHVSIQTMSAGHHQHAVKNPAKPMPKCFLTIASGGIIANWPINKGQT